MARPTRANIPTRLVAPIIEQYIAERDWPEHKEIGLEMHFWRYPVPVLFLAERVGVSASTIDSIMRCRRETTDFNIVDRIFCILGDPVYYWRRPGLRECYFEADLSDRTAQERKSEYDRKWRTARAQQAAAA